jgi:serine/threonine-protein kinase
MGVVYRAVDLKLGRAVALKVLPPDLADDEKAKARFVREARSASALDHPNIGTVHEIGEDGPTLFIVMAWYEGETLKQRLERGPLPVEEANGVWACGGACGGDCSSRYQTGQCDAHQKWREGARLWIG